MSEQTRFKRLGGMVGRYSGDDAPLQYLLAGILFLPVILSYAEVGSAVRGSSSPYQIALRQGSTWRVGTSTGTSQCELTIPAPVPQ